jgi:outer membrane protein insertion porin family
MKWRFIPHPVRLWRTGGIPLHERRTEKSETTAVKPWSLIVILFSSFALINNAGITTLAQDNNNHVVKIDVEGNTNIEKEEIIARLKDFIGQQIDSKKLQKGISTVYELGFFKDVRMKAVDTGEGITLIASVQEKPQLKNLRFAGNRFIPARLIQRALMLGPEERRFVDRKLLDDCTDKILKICRDSGYYFAIAYPRVELDEKTNEVSVKYIIDEGKRVKVKKILLLGNVQITSKEIFNLMSTKAGGFFASDIFSDTDFLKDIEKITSLYHKNGFIKALVSNSLTFDDTNEHVAILISIDEGIKYYVGNISIAGNTALSETEFREIFPLKEGDVFNKQSFFEGLNNIYGFYSRNGFLQFKCGYHITHRDEARKSDIDISIQEDKSFTINDIIIKGNKKTRDEIIKRLLSVKENEIFDGYKVFITQRKLEGLGYFKKISILTEPTEYYNKRNLIIEVEEGGTSMFEAGIKYSTAYDTSFYTRFDEKNLFGRAQRLTFKSDLGGRKENVSLSFVEPYLFSRNLRLNTDLYLTELKIPRRYFKERRSGGDIGLRAPLCGYTFGSIIYRHEEIKAFDIGPEISDYISPGKTSLGSLTTGLARDTRDSYLYPLKGSLNSLNLETSADFLGSDYDFIKTTAESDFYFNMIGETVFLIRLRGGTVSTLGGEMVPLFERFYLGGASTIRGYEEGEIAPRSGGKAMGIVNLEYKIPLTKSKAFISSLFYDIGNSWEKLSDFGEGGLKRGLGTSLDYNSRFGKMSLIYGYGIDKQKSEIYFNIGNNF